MLVQLVRRTLTYGHTFATVIYQSFLLFDLVFTFSHVFFLLTGFACQVTGEGSSQVLGLEKLCREGAGGQKVRLSCKIISRDRDV